MSDELWHDLLDAERVLRRSAEDLARRWREAFLSVAAVVAAGEYESHARAGVFQVPEEAARWVAAQAAQSVSGWRPVAAPARPREVERLAAEIERLRQENERLRQENERLAAESRPRSEPPRAPDKPPPPPPRPRPEPPQPPVPDKPPPPPQGTAAERAETGSGPKRAETGSVHPAATGETHPAPPLDVSELAQFVSGIKPPADFQEQFFEKDGLLVAVIGYFGVSSRPRLSKTLGSALGISSRSGSITRCFDRCARMGLVKIIKEPGAPFSLVCLTERGKSVFRQMFGYEPVLSEAELLLRSHPDARTHAVLCVWAREFAEVAGYDVIIPEPSPAPGPAPDLIFRHGNLVLPVEVERALGGDDPEKWRAVARRGTVAVIAADTETSERVAVYLRRAGVEEFLITDFSYLVSKGPRTPEEFWYIKSSTACGDKGCGV